MDLQRSIEKIQSYHDLSQFQNVYPDENIEYGLCKPTNEKLFLTASVAFLHKQLLKRLDEDSNSTLTKNWGTQTDLLLMESTNGQEIYISVKNAQKFEKILMHEATVPKNKLSVVQIIPKARKPKNKFTLFKVFVKKSNRSLFRKSKSTLSFSSSKKSVTTIREKKFDSENCDKLCAVPSAKFDLFKKFLTSTPSYTTALSPSTSSLELKFNRPQRENSTISLLSYNYPNSSSNYALLRELRQKNSDVSVFSYLNNICAERSLKFCESSKFRRKIDRSIMRTDDILKVDELWTSAQSCCSSSSSKRLKRQQSKLSVCREEESESSDDDDHTITNSTINQERNSISSQLTCNFTDELKSTLNPKLFEMILAKVIQDLQKDNI